MPFDQQEFELLRSFAAPGDAASTSPANPIDSDPVLRVLVEGRRLIQTSDCWIKNNWAKDVLGEVPERPADGTAVSWCLFGAMEQAEWNLGAQIDDVTAATTLLSRAVPSFAYNGCFISFNDSLTTTHADVLALFDRAIASRSPAIQGGKEG